MRNYGYSEILSTNTYILNFKDIEKFQSLEYDIFDSTYVYIDKLLKWGNNEMNEYLIKDFSLYINIFCRNVEFPDWFIKEYNVKDYHISLIRQMVFNYDEYLGNENICNLDLKRPFSSLNVLLDVAEKYLNTLTQDEIHILFIKYDESDDVELAYQLVDAEYELLHNIYIDVLNIVGHAVKKLSLTSLIYDSLHIWGSDFEPTEKGISDYKKAIRVKKLERIIEDEK